jgi:UDP-3-O-[3-hydroxymyristoyl] glucosamine N-acyltransferase
MEHPGFYERAGPFRLDHIARATGAELTLRDGLDPARLIHDVRPLSEAGPDDLTFLDNRKYISQLAQTRAAACLVQPTLAERVPGATTALQTRAPYHGFALALTLFYPTALRPLVAPPLDAAARDRSGDLGGDGRIARSARIEEGATIEPGAIIGPEATIGRGTIVAAGAVIGYRCAVGRDCFIGPHVSVTNALIGDRVILHAGVRIGQDGFGFAMGPKGHTKVPQIGRVIVQDNVEIGANSCVDRGALKDTIIGEGTKIDNLVQIGHNVVIGRHCVIVGQAAIAGSAELGDFVVMGGQSGVAGHLKIGAGSQIAGASHAKDSLEPRSKVVGTPAQPLRDWMKERLAIRRLTKGPATETPATGTASEDGNDPSI